MAEKGLRLDDLQNGYRIWQDPSMFCFGIDAVLLAHYPKLVEGEHIVDLGTGFAPIPHILCAEADKAGFRIHVTGIEIQERAAELSRRSVMLNGLKERIDIVTGDLREAAALCGAAKASLVVSNPPYVRAGCGLVSANMARSIARTELSCTLEDVVSSASRLLRPRGRFAMIHRPGRLAEIFAALTAHGLAPRRLRMVYPRRDAGASMVLVEAVRGGRHDLTVEAPLVVYRENGTYTEEVLRIYGRDTLSGRDSYRES